MTGVRMLRAPNFVKNYTIGCANSQKLYCWVRRFTKNYTAGYAIFIDKGLHSKIYTETACVSMLALKINYNLGSAY